MIAAIVWTIVALWLALTVCNQFARGKTVVARIDPANLVPIWTFFAPRPGRSDFHLVFRELDGERVTRGWTELYPVTTRGRLAWIWNPHKRRRKIVMDFSQTLARLAHESAADSGRIVLSIPYLSFLNAISSAGVPPPGRVRQFALLSSPGPDRVEPVRMVLCSARHAVCALPSVADSHAA